MLLEPGLVMIALGLGVGWHGTSGKKVAMTICRNVALYNGMGGALRPAIARSNCHSRAMPQSHGVVVTILAVLGRPDWRVDAVRVSGCLGESWTGPHEQDMRLPASI